jgi:hypothetical protein
MPTIAVVNRSTVMTDLEVEAITAALQKQVSQDFGPVWGVSATLVFVPKDQQPAPDQWWLSVLDTSDQADQLGYHDITPAGLPLGKAFAKSDKDGGYEPSVTISHELLEMLVDPEINLSAVIDGKLYAYEVCDPCEADEHGYKIDGILVSNFITPQWFQPTVGGNGPFDFQKKLDKPLTILSGGYYQYLEMSNSAGWQQVNAERATARLRARVGSRRERRRTSRHHWQTSEPKG